jgi:hypothetical protein
MDHDITEIHEYPLTTSLTFDAQGSDPLLFGLHQDVVSERFNVAA